MPRIKILSALDLIAFFEKEGFVIKSQQGSHVKMARAGIAGKQIIIIPKHKSIATGTLKAIYGQAKSFIEESKLYLFFYKQDK